MIFMFAARDPGLRVRQAVDDTRTAQGLSTAERPGSFRSAGRDAARRGSCSLAPVLPRPSRAHGAARNRRTALRPARHRTDPPMRPRTGSLPSRAAASSLAGCDENLSFPLQSDRDVSAGRALIRGGAVCPATWRHASRSTSRCLGGQLGSEARTEGQEGELRLLRAAGVAERNVAALAVLGGVETEGDLVEALGQVALGLYAASAVPRRTR